jgi:coenzyme PQQ biosynthesis protein B
LYDEVSRPTALVASGVGQITSGLRHAVHDSGVVLFDGTFGLMVNSDLSGRGPVSAREMNHIPIRDGSLDLLRQSPAARKIYTHVNNTNPILMPDSSERIQVEHAGIEIAYDGIRSCLMTSETLDRQTFIAKLHEVGFSRVSRQTTIPRCHERRAAFGRGRARLGG